MVFNDDYSIWEAIGRKAINELDYYQIHGFPQFVNSYFDYQQKNSFKKYVLGIIEKSSSVLEIGVGTGRWLDIILKDGYAGKYYGVDFVEKVVRLVHNKHNSIDVMVMNAPNLGLQDNSFDCVLTVSVLQHIPEWKRVLDHIVRVVKDDGMIIAFENVLLPMEREMYLRGFRVVERHYMQYGMLLRFALKFRKTPKCVLLFIALLSYPLELIFKRVMNGRLARNMIGVYKRLASELPQS